VAGHPQEALKQVAGYHSILFDPIKKLYHHIWDDDLQEFTRKEFWGVGNGWAAAGITRVIRALPEEMRAEKELVVGFMRQALDGCLHYQRADGLFHNILDDPNSFIETNAAQMLSYTIYRGVAGGWLDRVYLERADAMREAVYQKIDEFGLVQGVCGAPNFDRPGTAAEGQSFFLLMEAAHSDLS